MSQFLEKKKGRYFFLQKKLMDIIIGLGGHLPIKKKYNFFTGKNLNSSEIKRVLDNIKNCSQENWEKKNIIVL